MKSLINEVIARSKNKTKFLREYFEAAIMGFLNRRKYKEISSFCFFLGYGRSGHTLVGSLLDAHPDIVIGIEWGLLTYLNLGYSKNQIFYSLIKNSKQFTEAKNNIWTNYSYRVENSWQGKYRTLKVIGDKHGGSNSVKLFIEPNLIDKVVKKLKKEIKIIHVIRNPFDIITTTTIRRLHMRDPKYKASTMDLLPFIKHFFNQSSTVYKIKHENKYQMMDIYHEDLINNPKTVLSNVIKFMELEYIPEHIENCAAIVYQKPNKSRHSLTWPKELISYVEKELSKYPFLKQYKYSD